MPTAVRGEPARPPITASPDELLAALLERTPSPPDYLLTLIRTACADTDTHPFAQTLPTEPTLVAEVLSWLNPLLEPLSGPWTADAFRQRGAATAIAARALAGLPCRVGTAHNPCGAAFTCGLLLKVGQLALYAVFPKGYSRAVSRAARSSGGILAGEREIFGLDHLHAGKRIAETWRLPTLVRDALSGARETGADAPAHRAVLAAVRRADQLVRRESIGWPDFVPAIEDSQIDVRVPSDLRAAADELIAIASVAPHDARSPEPNPKRDDARWRVALRELLEEADEGDIQRACASVARCVRSALKVPVAVAFAAETRGRLHPALILTTDERPTRLVLPPELLIAIASGEQLSRAPTELLAANPPLAFAFAGRGSETLLLRMHHDGRMVGGVLLPASAALAKCDAGDLALLAAACAHVMRAAQAVESQRRLAEAPDGLRPRGDRAALPHASTLEPLAALAAGAAHELNTPLAVIAGRAQMLQQQVHDTRIRRELAAINEHAQRASGIVSELLACAKPQAPRPESIRLSDWVDRLRQHWQADTPSGSVQITARISDDDVRVHADPAQLSEAAHAFITNAVEASPPGDARVTINSISRPTDETIVVSIGDNGRGMSAETLAQACAPFFSARPAGRGRGLGLSRAARLIEINGGRMWIDSTLGKGTTVHLALPARAN